MPCESPTYQDYLKAGFTSVLCRGYAPKYNPSKDYKTAKEPVFGGWNKSEYDAPP
jgi:hypothetical protein